jgi:hypothetical protein
MLYHLLTSRMTSLLYWPKWIWMLINAKSRRVYCAILTTQYLSLIKFLVSKLFPWYGGSFRCTTEWILRVINVKRIHRNRIVSDALDFWYTVDERFKFSRKCVESLSALWHLRARAAARHPATEMSIQWEWIKYHMVVITGLMSAASISPSLSLTCIWSNTNFATLSSTLTQHQPVCK